LPAADVESVALCSQTVAHPRADAKRLQIVHKLLQSVSKHENQPIQSADRFALFPVVLSPALQAGAGVPSVATTKNMSRSASAIPLQIECTPRLELKS
jgi:hypothetical protein